MTNKKLEKLLYKSFDAELSIRESKILENELKNSKKLRKLQEQISAIRKAVQYSKSESLKPFFEERVLNKIKSNSEPISFYNELGEMFGTVFKQIALGAVILIVALVIYNFNQGNNEGVKSIFGANNFPIQYALDPATYIWEK
jgi:hypothetical protein